MPSLFEMLQDTPGGAVHQNLSQQFGLNPEQTEQAIEALMPAFSYGLKQNTADPAGFASFMQALSSGQHAKYMENPAEVFSPNGVQDGNAILSHLFGNKDVSRAVAAQAAQATGIGENILKQMLPALAPMVLGGLFNQMQSSGPGTSNAGASSSSASQFGSSGKNPLGQILEQMMGGGLKSAPSGNGRKSGRNPLEDLLGQMMGGGKQYSPQPKGRRQSAPIDNPPIDNPLEKIFEEMLGGGSSNRNSPTPRYNPQPQKSQPRAQPRGRSGGGLGDLFGDMFDTGRQTQENYQNELGSIFDEFLKGKR